jgi:serine/threonine-protein kinase
MAPEQLSGVRDLSDRVDVYAVGVLLFELLAGRHPFEGAAPREMIASHLHAAPPELRTVMPTLPEPLAQMVARCLAKAPGERPSAAELGQLCEEHAFALGAPPLEAMEQNDQVHDESSVAIAQHATKVIVKGAG